MWILEYFEKVRIEKKKEGIKYTLGLLSQDLGCARYCLSNILSGLKIISIKMAERFEKSSNGEMKTDELLEKSIERHKKYLERKARFGNLYELDKKMDLEILKNGPGRISL